MKGYLLVLVIVVATTVNARSLSKKEVSERQVEAHDLTKGATCTASSEHSSGYACSKVFQDSGDWATRSQGVGAWIKIRLTKSSKISRIMYQQRITGTCGASCENFRSMELQFDNGETRTIELANNRQRQSFAISPPVTSQTVKIVSKSVWNSINNGAARIIFEGTEATTTTPTPTTTEAPTTTKKAEAHDLTKGATCTASSEYSSSYTCTKVFQDSGDWATKNQGVGAWIEIHLAKRSEISGIMYQQRITGSCGASCENFRSMELQFDNGETRTIELANNRQRQSFAISPPVISQTVKIVSKSVWNSINNGAARIILEGTEATTTTPTPTTTEAPTTTTKCEDSNKLCDYWASVGECSHNHRFMLKGCCLTCRQHGESGF